MAALPKFLIRLLTGRGWQEVSPAQAGGISYAGQIPALDATTGLLAMTMMPVGVGAEIDNSGICGATALTAGMLVNFYDTAGAKTVRPADNSDNTKPAEGFVLVGFTVGQTVTVYLPGQTNNLIPLGAFVAADAGKPLYLSAAGAVTLTRLPDASTGKLDQYVGDVINIGTTVSSSFIPGIPVTCA